MRGKNLSATGLILAAFVLMQVVASAAPALQFHEEPTETKFVIKSLTLPTDLEMGERLVGQAVIANQGDGGGTGLIELRINGKLDSLFDVRLAPGETSVYPIRHNFMEMGTFEVEVRTPHDSKSQTVNYAAAAQDEGEEPTEPPQSGSNPTFSLKSFDSDGDCMIGDGEFFDVIDRWVTGTISEGLFFSAVDVWIGQRSVCTAAAIAIRRVSLSAQMTALGVTFSAAGLGNSPLTIEVYATTGELVFRETSSASQLRWNLRDREGAPVANGVYLYRIVTDSQNPNTLREIKKLAIVR